MSEIATVNVNLHIDDYSNRVLGVIKERFGLKDKSQALMYLTKKCGKEYVEEVVKDEFVEEVLRISAEHKKKYPNRRMSVAELDKLFSSE
jgi:hypothetical protein